MMVIYGPQKFQMAPENAEGGQTSDLGTTLEWSQLPFSIHI